MVQNAYHGQAVVQVVTNFVSKHGSWSQGVCKITSGKVLFIGVQHATLISRRLLGVQEMFPFFVIQFVLQSLNCPLINDHLCFRNTVMPPRHIIDQNAQADEVRPTHGIWTRNRSHTSKLVPTLGVPPVPTSPLQALRTDDNCPSTTQRDILNAEFRESIHILTQLVANQAQRLEAVGSTSIIFEATRVGHFMKMNAPKFTGTKVEEDPQKFVDEM